MKRKNQPKPKIIMLSLRPTCENCNKPLPPNSIEAMICTFECTFCSECVTNVLHNVCPNCGGGFEKRPLRPKALLTKYPASAAIVHKPVVMQTFLPLRDANSATKPENR